jgi:hypothetical protein
VVTGAGRFLALASMSMGAVGLNACSEPGEPDTWRRASFESTAGRLQWAASSEEIRLVAPDSVRYEWWPDRRSAAPFPYDGIVDVCFDSRGRVCSISAISGPFPPALLSLRLSEPERICTTMGVQVTPPNKKPWDSSMEQYNLDEPAPPFPIMAYDDVAGLITHFLAPPNTAIGGVPPGWVEAGRVHTCFDATGRMQHWDLSQHRVDFDPFWVFPGRWYVDGTDPEFPGPFCTDLELFKRGSPGHICGPEFVEPLK